MPRSDSRPRTLVHHVTGEARARVHRAAGLLELSCGAARRRRTGIVFSKDGKLAFVAIGRANRVAVVDTATYEVRDFILIGQRPWHMALSPDGSKLYTANGLTNDMTVIDVGSLKAEKSVPVGRLPWGIVIKP